MLSFIDKTLSLPQRFVEHLGLAVQDYARGLYWLFRGRVRWKETLIQCQRLGVESLPMVVILATIGGGVLSLQLCNTLAQNGADAYVGGLVAIAVVREVAPIFTALALAARSGTAIASELAHKKLTRQIDALQVLQVSPYRYLVLPRILAYFLMLPLLAVVAALIAVLSGMVVARLELGMNYTYFIQSIYKNLPTVDLIEMIGKSLVFGVIVGMVAIKFGMNVRGGAREVGLAAMKTAVWISVAVLVADLFMTWAFKVLL